MPVYQVNSGDRILAADLNAYYNLLKGVAASGEAVTFVYNAAGVLILQPSSDPAAGTELIQIKNNAGVVQSAFSSDGRLYPADGLVGTPGVAFEADKDTGLYRTTTNTLDVSAGGVRISTFDTNGLTMQAKRVHLAKGADIASAAALTPGADGNYFHVTGTTTVTSIAAAQAGSVIYLEFDGAVLLTHNGTSLILQGATNYTTAAGDVLAFMSEGSGNWRELLRRLVAGTGYTQGARVTHNANQSINDVTETALAFNTEDYDTDAIHDTVTNNSRLTCKTAGKYNIWANIEFAANATGQRQVEIRLNGTTLIGLAEINATAARTANVPVSCTYSLAVNDYVECVVYQNSTGALNVTTQSKYSPLFGMDKIG